MVVNEERWAGRELIAGLSDLIRRMHKVLLPREKLTLSEHDVHNRTCKRWAAPMNRTDVMYTLHSQA